MKVQAITKLDAKLPTAFFVLEENLAAVQALLPIAGVKLAKNYAAADELKTFATPQATMYLQGAGKAAEVQLEKVRKAIHKLMARANEEKHTTLQVVFVGIKQHALAKEITQSLAEVAVLGSYQFLKYRAAKEKVKLQFKLQTVRVYTDAPDTAKAVQMGVHTAEAVCLARDLVNEPPNVLTAVTLAKAAQAAGKKYGFSVEVFEKKKIESLKMGGLLAVNQGSQTPPTFSVLEYKPARARNKKPIVLVGKGVTFDTGGLSLKPTADSMDYMKSDMAGAAAVIATLAALAASGVAAHVIGLIPSTDNRPGENAYTPNDVITISDGTSVEVLNTDAEGRLILADALVFARQYKPEVVIDLATLTGAAVIAVGNIGIVMMSTAAATVNDALKESGLRVHERLIELPLWPEYRDQLKSEVADMKNVGGRYAGAITAGKFLEHFTSYPWVHLDIAGPAFLHGADSYRGKGGTGVGVRLLVDFIRNQVG